MKNHAAHHKDIADILGSVRDRDHYTVMLQNRPKKKPRN